jgi:hypothetical protein
MPTKIVSFKNAAPAAEAPASNVNAPAVEDDEALSPATQSTSLAPASDYGVDAQDITLPRLRLLQGTSDKAQLAKFGFGSLLLKDSVVVARPLVPTTPGAPASPTARVGRVVFCRLASKGYAEKGSKKAMEIGAAVAYKQGVKKYGKEVMAKKAIAGKKKKK